MRGRQVRRGSSLKPQTLASGRAPHGRLARSDTRDWGAAGLIACALDRGMGTPFPQASAPFPLALPAFDARAANGSHRRSCLCSSERSAPDALPM